MWCVGYVAEVAEARLAEIDVHKLAKLAPPEGQSSLGSMTRTAEVQTILLLLLYRRIKRCKRRQRRFWVREIFAQRRQRGSFSMLVQDMRISDSQSHFQYFRMSKERFDNLLHKVS